MWACPLEVRRKAEPRGSGHPLVVRSQPRAGLRRRGVSVRSPPRQRPASVPLGPGSRAGMLRALSLLPLTRGKGKSEKHRNSHKNRLLFSEHPRYKHRGGDISIIVVKSIGLYPTHKVFPLLLAITVSISDRKPDKLFSGDFYRSGICRVFIEGVVKKEDRYSPQMEKTLSRTSDLNMIVKNDSIFRQTFFDSVPFRRDEKGKCLMIILMICAWSVLIQIFFYVVTFPVIFNAVYHRRVQHIIHHID